MTDEQLEAYGSARHVKSDPFDWLDRANRNHWKKLRVITDTMAANPGGSVLEVGCGDGLHAAKLDSEYDYTGVDLSGTLVAETRKRLTRGSAVVMDATKLSFDDDEFDSVVGNAVLHHIADPLAALEEWVRVTRPGGSVTIMEPNYLFPKDFVETHTIPEERHKKNIAPCRLAPILDSVDGVSWSVRPALYTPPFPERLMGVYDVIDDVFSRLPLVRWLSQLYLIHIEVRRESPDK